MNDLTPFPPTNFRPAKSLEAQMRELQGRMDKVEGRVDVVETKLDILAREFLALGYSMEEIQEAIRDLQEKENRAYNLRQLRPAPVQQQALPSYQTVSRPAPHRKAMIWAAAIAAGLIGVAGGVLLAPKVMPASPAVTQPPVQTVSQPTSNTKNHHHKTNS